MSSTSRTRQAPPTPGLRPADVRHADTARLKACEADACAPARPRSLVRRLAPVAALALVALVAWRMGALHHFTLEGFLAKREALVAAVAASPLQTWAGFALLYAVVVALSVPGGLILTVTAGFLFGPALGGLAAVAGATAGSTLLFLIARTSIGDLLRSRIHGRLGCFAEGFRRDAFNYLLFLRLAPVAPFWLVNLVPAFLGVTTRTFVAATVIGILPATFAFATVGAGLDSVIEAQRAAKAACLQAGTCHLTLDPGALLTPGLVGALLALAAVALLPVAVRRWRRRGRGC
ncbi:TVP38/TMEM64 family protein [Chthonobacter rhizosphaerae]|uniref:TVP38/TMEM64 family protein n=1 Tax=Chthonobacter rhizosphaerae TaxID=2735553 RepID=UPI0015EEE0D0|nr:TVP38/TMEM64 family protein [Chthonobacter rhizosphaerae]